MFNLLKVEYLIVGKQYFSHLKKPDEQKEPLIDHMNLTMKYFSLYCDKKNIMTVIESLISKSGFDENESVIIKDFFINAIYLHDIGKINPDYQRIKMRNEQFKTIGIGTVHSIYSSIIYIAELLKANPKINRKCFMTMLAFAYVISCHHGCLTSPADFEDNLKTFTENGFYRFDMKDALDNPQNIGLGSTKMAQLFNESQSIAFFVLLRLLFAVMTACDFCATTEFMNGTKHTVNTIEDIDVYSKKYYDSALLKKIKSHKRSSDINSLNSINSLRTEIFLETEELLTKNKDARVFYLEAPTGSGKTNTSINLALKLIENDRTLNNIFYVFPFNTLVEQTAKTLSDYFNDEEMAIVNSISPIYISDAGSEQDEEIDYNSLWLNRLVNNYQLVVTTHVNFFDALFGTDKEQVFPLIKLCNSVIIIDEIQSYRNLIWPEIIIFLSNYAELLNMRIIIMSATLPRIDCVFNVNDVVFAELLADRGKYYKHPVFKDRVKIDASLMDNNNIDLDALADHVLSHTDKKVLVEFITKTGARDFYNIISNKIDQKGLRNVKAFELTGDDCSLNRKEIIDKAKEDVPIILVATQVIEAGIDIDMDIGYKEISLPDSEEQFLGRINRSCLKSDSKAFFFNKTKPEVIYKSDCRVNHSINNNEILEYLKEKDFMGIYSHILNDLKVKRGQKNSQNIQESISLCQLLKFKKLEEKMQLISPSMQIFIPYIFKTERGEEYNGYTIWEEFKSVCSTSCDYAEKKVQLSAIRAKMEPFIFNLVNTKDEAIGLQLEEFGGIYFVEDGERFIENGKFDRKAFNAFYKGRFL